MQKLGQVSLLMTLMLMGACAGARGGNVDAQPARGSGGTGGTSRTGGSGPSGTGGTGGASAPVPAPVTPDAGTGALDGAGSGGDASTGASDAAASDGKLAADAAGDGVADGAASPNPDGGAPVPLGTRFSLEDTVAARWTGTRRTVVGEAGSRVFTGAFEAGKFGAGGNGHLVRFPLQPGREYVFEYRIRFDAGFDFSRGGKIPGLAGATAPSGCQTSTGTGFTARQMWREQGRLIGYIYDMDQRSDCGNAVETGLNFAVGRWYSVKQRIKLNTGSSHNGVLQLWIDDKAVIDRSNMGWMIEAPDRRIDRIFLDFFFGGSTADWSPSRNCSISFADLYVTRLAD